MTDLPLVTEAAHQRIAPYESRRQFLKTTGITAGAWLLSPVERLSRTGAPIDRSQSTQASESGSADYTLHITTSPVLSTFTATVLS
jgi:hypothetical protein